MPTLTALVWALPWILLAVASPLLFRARPRLKDEKSPAADESPLVSVIVPARNEAFNIGGCVGSILHSRYSSMEIIVVDDESRDGTGDIAHNIAAQDSRVRLIRSEPLPVGWMGKSWACWQGYQAARGDLLVFTDADTRHEPGLLGRSIGALRRNGAGLVSVIPRQVIISFWERVVLPHVFLIMRMRYPDLARINRSRNPRSVIANGQFLLFEREAYEAVGGHEAVRHEIVEDLRLAQRMVESGRRLHLTHGEDFMQTRMYRSLAGIVEGWSKNLAAGSRQSVGRLMGPLLPWLLALAVAAFWLLPAAALFAGLAGRTTPEVHGWGLIASAACLCFWLLAFTAFRAPRIYALTWPLGAAMTAFLLVRSAARGPKITWKERTYAADERDRPSPST